MFLLHCMNVDKISFRYETDIKFIISIRLLQCFEKVLRQFEEKTKKMKKMNLKDTFKLQVLKLTIYYLINNKLQVKLNKYPQVHFA